MSTLLSRPFRRIQAQLAARPFLGGLLFLLLASGAGFGGAALHAVLLERPATSATNDGIPPQKLPAVPANYAELNSDFVRAAREGSPSVVFIKTVSQSRNKRGDYWWDFYDFFGYGRGPVTSAGSGVILSPKGYIVTNNHVVDQAEKITVIMTDKRKFAAEIVGTDPNTDLALLKIEAEGELKPITLGNSDDVRIGEWVLAVGNPLNLTSTITAGIVSAKGRNINLLNSQFPIESFIQTDAAINPGNSGGALINTQGELIGINTAIKSETGAYSGYGFAIPVNIVSKVVEDILKYGSVQQAFLGVEATDINQDIARKLGLDNLHGVLLREVGKESAAEQAGLRPGDVILSVDDHPVHTHAQLDERLAFHRPGDKISITYKRDGKQHSTTATLTNRNGGTGVLKSRKTYSEVLGAELAPLSKIERQKYHVEHGFRIASLRRGRLQKMGLSEGAVILAVNNQVPKSIAELEDLLMHSRGRVVLEVLNRSGERIRYTFFTY